MFDANGGSGTMANQIILLGTAMETSEHMFEKGEYTFIGWRIDNPTTGTFIPTNKTITDTDLFRPNTVYTLYAQWRLVTITTPDLEYDNLYENFVFDTISLSADGTYPQDFDVVICKYDLLDNLIDCKTHHVANFTEEATIGTFNSNEYIRIFVFDDASGQGLIAWQFVQPILFMF